MRPTVSSPPLPENPRRGTKLSLAVAIAQGDTAASWAQANGVEKRTAQRWAHERDVRTMVEKIRRTALDRAVGLMTRHVNGAAKQIVDLGKSASSESVRLAASRAVISDMMAVSKFGGLEDRMTEIEDHIDAANRNKSRAR